MQALSKILEIRKTSPEMIKNFNITERILKFQRENYQKNNGNFFQSWKTCFLE